jgi:hypothetical protein
MPDPVVSVRLQDVELERLDRVVSTMRERHPYGTITRHSVMRRWFRQKLERAERELRREGSRGSRELEE